MKKSAYWAERAEMVSKVGQDGKLEREAAYRTQMFEADIARLAGRLKALGGSVEALYSKGTYPGNEATAIEVGEMIADELDEVIEIIKKYHMPSVAFSAKMVDRVVNRG